jgi:hypothetical protein
VVTEQERKFIEEAQHALCAVVYSEGEVLVLHAVFYEEPPTPNDWKLIYDELETNPEFKLHKREDWIIISATPAMIGVVKKAMLEDDPEAVYHSEGFEDER